MNKLGQLADFISSLQIKNVPFEVREIAALRILDLVGVAVGASQNPLLKEIRNTYISLAEQGYRTSIWGGDRSSLLTSVFLNAMSGHILELDDVHIKSKTHIGTVVVPAAWALTEYLGKSGEDLVLAVVCGYETMSRIGAALGVSSHRNKGWHVTSTAGTFGAAAACAKLLGLSVDQTISALGMAGTQSFGLWAFLESGANSKTLHPARASVSGCEAAWLAKSGMIGPNKILDADDGGLLRAMSDEPSLEQVSKDLGKTWQIKYMDNKPYPCCRSTHCAIDAALTLQKNNNIPTDQIESIEVGTYLVGNKQCGVSDTSRNPQTPVHAKFSTPYTVACALMNGSVSLDDFTPAAISRTDVRTLLRKVSVVTEDKYTKMYPDHWGCRVVIHDAFGQTWETEILDASGSVNKPLTTEQIIIKTENLIKPVFPGQYSDIVNKVLSITSQKRLPELAITTDRDEKK